MQLRQLHHFLAVADELHFGRAAARLNMTQPPLSQSIQALETELGVQLFLRTKRNVELSPVGKAWAPHARRVIEEAAALPATARRLARGEMGLLRLGFVSTADYGMLPPAITRFRTTHPDVEITLREATSDVQTEAVLNDELDLGLVIAPPRAALHKALVYHRLWREPLVAVVPETWVRDGRAGFGANPLAPSSLLAAPFILFPRRSAPVFHDLVSGYFADHGVPFSVHQEAIQMQTIIGLVASGLGVSMVPRSLTTLKRDGAIYVPLSGRVPEVETGLIWRRDNKAATVRNFVSSVSDLQALD
ncbi:LysR family transcriptional regulator [Mesorhizobium loti]|nr:LysR family transcriptional regulator [Mesorhizobium loti]